MKVGFQGVPGAYSEIAALRYFRNEIGPENLRHYASFEEVFEALMAAKVRYAVLPIENSLAGSIHENYDHLLNAEVWISGEYKLKVDHSLLVSKAVKSIDEIEEVISHPQALSQCAAYLRNLGVRIRPYFDTAGSARQVAEGGNLHIAAIAGAHAAKDYGLKVLATSIQDHDQNFTRFFVLQKRGRRQPRCDWKGKSKTSIVFALKNVPGGLHKALSVFAIRDIDLTKIESRPLRGSPWKYLFYCDFEGHRDDEAVSRVLAHLDEITEFCKVLGSYEQSR